MSADAPSRTLTPEDMLRLVDEHIKAEMAGDLDGAVAVYTDDVVHETIGAPTGPLVGPAAARGFYEWLTSTLDTNEMQLTKARFGDDHCTVEHLATATVHGEFMGIPGNGKRITFRMLHVWDFADGKISGEQIWLDGGSIAEQLTS
jgi:steroid delta-isomerase-like uncharacterized protein